MVKPCQVKLKRPTRIVEREDDDDRDRQEQVEEREHGEDRERVPAYERPQASQHARPVTRAGDGFDGGRHAVPVRHALGPDAPGVDDDQDEDRRHEDEGESRCLRIVGHLFEAALDHVPDHLLLRRAQKLSVDEVAAGRDESQEGSGEDARERERERHLEEGLDPIRVEILRRFDQPRVDLLEADVDRERHEGQEVVGDPRDDRGRRREEPPVRGDEVQVAEDRDDEAVILQDRLPGERPDEVRDEERRDDEQEQQVLPAPAAEGDPVREGVADEEARRASRCPRTRASG